MSDQNGGLAVRVLAPNGGEMLNVGQQVNITWQSSGAASHAVKLSTDGGVTFNDIAAELPGSAQFYTWVVPSLSTNQARIRVAVRDAAGNRLTDDSDGLLSIQTPPAPVVTSVTPTSGPLTGGTSITVVGQNFKNGCSVKVGSVDAVNITFIDSTRVLATTPVGPAGAANVRVVNPDGQGGGLPLSFTYVQVPAPVVSSVSPNNGPINGGTQIIVTGQNFKSGCTVNVGGINALNVMFLDSTRVQATTPAGALGAANVRVVNPDGQGGGLSASFTYTQVTVPAPTVSSVSPVSGPTTGGTQITITGQNFKSGCTVKVGSVDATNVIFLDASHVQATTPAAAVGAANVRVVNPDGQGGGLTSAFTYTQVMAAAPVVTSVAPTSGPTTGGTQITITGQNFKSGCTVKIGSVDATNVVFVDASHVQATTPAGAAGAMNVRVVNPDGQGGGLASAFTYTQVMASAPVITSLSPANGPTTGGTVVTIIGRNFQTGCVVRFAGIDAAVQSVSAMQIVARTPVRVTAGLADLFISNPDGMSVTLPSAFRYDVPQATLSITVMAPNGGEILTAGGQYVIQWRSTGATSHRVQYSTDNGLTWVPIVTGLAGAAQSYNWSIPITIVPNGAQSIAVLIRVVARDAAGNEAFDANDGAVTIRPSVNDDFDTDTSVEAASALLVKAAGEPAIYDRKVNNAEEGNTLLCVTRSVVPLAQNQVSLPITVRASSIGPACGAGFIQRCTGQGSDASDCGRYFVEVATTIFTPPGLYLFNVLGSSGQFLKQLQLTIQSPKVNIVVTSPKALSVKAGQPATYQIDVRRAGYLGPIELTSSLDLANTTVTFDPPVIPQRTSGPDSVEHVTLTIMTEKPSATLDTIDPGTPIGNYQFTISSKIPAGIPLEVSPAGAQIAVDVRPDIDLVIDPITQGVEQGKTVTFDLLVYMYNMQTEILPEITVQPSGTFTPSAMVVRNRERDLTNSRGKLVEYTVLVTADANTPASDDPYDVTATVAFMRDGEPKTAMITAKLRVRPMSGATINLSATLFGMTQRVGCANYTVTVSPDNVENKIKLTTSGLPATIKPTFNPTEIDPKDGIGMSVLTLEVPDTVIEQTYTFTIGAEDSTNPKITAEPVIATLSVQGGPRVKVIPTPGNETVEIFAGKGNTFLFDVIRAQSGTCKQSYSKPIRILYPDGPPRGFKAAMVLNDGSNGSGPTFRVDTNADARPDTYTFTIGAEAVDGDATVDGTEVRVIVKGGGIIVNSPATGMQFQGGQDLTVTWATQGAVATFDIQLSTNGLAFNNIVHNLAMSATSYTFMLQNPPGASGSVVDAVVRVVGHDTTGRTVAMGDKPFKIAFTDKPVINDIVPSHAARRASIMIAGSSFVPGKTQVFFATGPTTMVMASATVQATMITTTVPATAITGPVTVRNPRLDPGIPTDTSAFFMVDGAAATPPPDPARQPQISSLAPVRGLPGASVQIVGTAFDGVTAVAFNGVVARFTAISATSITAVVPPGARTGPITVTTPGGTARSTVQFQVLVAGAPTGGLPGGNPSGGRLSGSVPDNDNGIDPELTL